MGDDQAGLIVADRLRASNLPHTVIEQDEVPGSALASGLDDAIRLLVVVDAAPGDERHAAGSFERIDYRAHPEILTERITRTTHTLSVETGLRIADTLGALPDEVWIYALFGSVFERALETSPAVDDGVAPLVERIEQDVRDWLAASELHDRVD